MFRKFTFLVIAVLTSFSHSIFAVGLGEYQLYSGLNQNFKAEIALLSVKDVAEHELVASLASPAEFEKVGVERLFALNSLAFTVKKGSKGRLVVKVSSSEPIKEPFLNFLVELNWPNGRIIREYTFLLDPPVFDDSTSSTIQQAKTSSKPRKITPQAKSRPVVSRSQPRHSGSSYTVSANDTLWGIASRTRGNASVHQMLVAIYRANPDAFIKGNINNLSRGAVLTIPDDEEVNRVPHRAALQDVVMQNREWSSGGARRIVDNNKKVSSVKSSSQEARLSLAAPASDSGDAKSGAGNNEAIELRNQLASIKEKNATIQAENDELRARMNDILKKLEETQDSSTLDIADTELALLTQSDDQKSEEESDLEQSDLTKDTADIEIAEGDLSAESQDQADSTLAEDDTTQSQIDANSEVSQPESTTPKVSTVPVVKSQPKPKSFLDELLESGGLLWGSIIGVIALIVIAVFWRMKKRMQENDFQDDLVASTGASLADNPEDFELPDVGDDMLVQLDMDDEEDKVTSDNESFDALGEADIYIAYGKYDEAETLLLESIEDNPIRSDLKVKLMECYVESQNKEKFEALEEEVSQAIDADEWQQHIKDMKEKAWSGETDIDMDADDSFDLPSSDDIFDGADSSALDDSSDVEDVLDLDSTSNVAEESTEDFRLDDAEDLLEEEFDIDMDFAETETGSDISSESTDISPDAVTETFDSIDDELALDDSKIDEDNLSLDDEEIDLDGEDFSFDDDADFGDEESEDAGDEISTKLDLARAYIDMGDADGAKEILDEVLAEGSDEQKKEAQELINQGR